jgi:transcription termination/antitermination protein NusG
MSEFPPNRWFVVQVRPKAEKMVASLLRFKGYEYFLPVYQPFQDKNSPSHSYPELPLFPGYVFCTSTPLANGLIVTTPGVVRILGIGSKPQPIDDIEIATLRAVQHTGFPLRPWPKLEPGDLVTIMDGPLCGCRGVLKCRKNQAELVVSVELLQRSVLVTVPSSAISVIRAQPLHESPARRTPMSALSLRRVG